MKLFGILGLQMGERSVALQLAEGARLRDLFEVLGEHFGAKFGEAIFRQPGVLQTYVRIFLDDVPVDDLDTPLTASLPPHLDVGTISHDGEGTHAADRASAKPRGEEQARVGLMVMSAVEGG